MAKETSGSTKTEKTKVSLRLVHGLLDSQAFMRTFELQRESDQDSGDPFSGLAQCYIPLADAEAIKTIGFWHGFLFGAIATLLTLGLIFVIGRLLGG